MKNIKKKILSIWSAILSFFVRGNKGRKLDLNFYSEYSPRSKHYEGRGGSGFGQSALNRKAKGIPATRKAQKKISFYERKKLLGRLLERNKKISPHIG